MNFLISNICANHCFLLTKCPVIIQTASFMKLVIPPKKEEVEFPDTRRKLRAFEKVPQPPIHNKPLKWSKDLELMRGPELVHNKLIYGKFGIQATTGGRLKHNNYEVIRILVNRAIDEKTTFATWRVGQTYQPVTNHGQAARMGKGKGIIKYHVFPVKAGRIILEIGGECKFEEVEKLLNSLRTTMPFRARVVTRELLEEEEKQEKLIQEKNINPFSFEKCAKNNYGGVTVFLSPYDLLYGGKYR